MPQLRRTDHLDQDPLRHLSTATPARDVHRCARAPQFPPGVAVSWQASKYARAVLESSTTAELTTADRLVLMLLAERADRTSGTSWGGRWLQTAAGLTEGALRRCIHRLGAAGIVTVDSNPPRALAVRFPVAASLSTTRAPQPGSETRQPAPHSASPGPHSAGTRALQPAIPINDQSELPDVAPPTPEYLQARQALRNKIGASR
jgi:hypothetical protein